MINKQAIYQDILRRTSPHLRNVTTLSWWRRLRDRSAYFETELLHNLWPSLFEPGFVEHDIWFLNAQAKVYYEECSERLSPLYADNVKCIKELFELVPDRFRDRLKWSGPK